MSSLWNTLKKGKPIKIPPVLTSHQRSVVHKIAEALDLGHESVGEGSSRYIHVWRADVAPKVE